MHHLPPFEEECAEKRLGMDRITFDRRGTPLIFHADTMADIPPPNPPPGPTGAVPPPKKETGKVQPKKETVRINLPPKPTAAPTIKLPTLPPGGPTGAPSAPAAMAPPPATAPGNKLAAPAAAKPPTATAAAPAAQQRPTTMPRPAAPVVPTIKTLDKALIYSAAFAALIGAGLNVWVFWFVLKPMIENFQP